MSAHVVELPEPLRTFADEAMPELGGVADVTFLYGPTLPFDWLPGDRKRYSAMTLWRTIHVRDRGEPFEPLKPYWLELVLHELVHVAQVSRLGDVGFPASYLLGLARHGYQDHPLEREAREMAKLLVARFHAR